VCEAEGVRYIIYGAGAVGGVIGGRLAAVDREVVLVARGSHLEALRSRGLLLRDPDSDTRPPVGVAGSIAEAAPEPGDVVFLTMKTQDTAAAHDELAALAPPGVAVVCAQNGVENERLALRRWPDVHAMCVVLPASHSEPGVVHAESAPVSGVLDLGRYPTGADSVDDRIVDDLRSARFDAYVDPSVMRWKNTKLLANLGNAIEATVGGSASGASDLHKRLRGEGTDCFEAAGLEWATSDEEKAHRVRLSPLRAVGGHHRGGGSSWQSLARRTGTIEADWLNGEIVLLGRLHGVPTPVNAMLQAAANRMARERRDPGSLSIDDLHRLLPDG
jgi:2-dehydropantoate 2-reductase